MVEKCKPNSSNSPSWIRHQSFRGLKIAAVVASCHGNISIADCVQLLYSFKVDCVRKIAKNATHLA